MSSRPVLSELTGATGRGGGETSITASTIRVGSGLSSCGGGKHGLGSSVYVSPRPHGLHCSAREWADPTPRGIPHCVMPLVSLIMVAWPRRLLLDVTVKAT
jgi:hypothetical protein